MTWTVDRKESRPASSQETKERITTLSLPLPVSEIRQTRLLNVNPRAVQFFIWVKSTFGGGGGWKGRQRIGLDNPPLKNHIIKGRSRFRSEGKEDPVWYKKGDLETS